MSSSNHKMTHSEAGKLGAIASRAYHLINGSYNIMRKGLVKVALDDKVTYSECRGFVYNPDKFNLK